MKLRHYIFVVGSQRTGTTLLGQILGAHPQAVLIDENNSVYPLIETLLTEPQNEKHLLRQCLASARNQYVEDNRFTEQGALSDSVTHLVLKAPNATYEYERLRQIHHSRLHFVFAVRDVRDVVCSMQRLVHIPMVDNQLKHIARYSHLETRFAQDLKMIRSPDTADHVRKALIWKSKSGLYTEFVPAPLNALLVRYEDLVSAPDHWMARVLDHVGLAEATLHHEDVFQGLGPGFTVRTRAIDKTSLSRWQRHLSAEQEQAIWNAAGGLMQEFGYQRDQQRAETPPAPWGKIAQEIMARPVVATGHGGHASRLLSLILQEHSLFLGNRLNAISESTEWVDLVYELALKKLKGQLPSDAPWRQELVGRAGHILGQGSWNEAQPWGWKLPETALILPEVVQAFSDARIVHLVRHPVDVCLRSASMKALVNNRIGAATLTAAYRWLNWDRDPRNDAEHLRYAAFWVYQVDHAVRFGSGLGAERYLEIKGEDLCTHPQIASDTIAVFLGRPALTTALTPIIDTTSTSLGDDERASEVWSICEKTATALGYRFIEPGLAQSRHC